MSTSTKWRCTECDRPCLASEFLVGVNPFDPDDGINGCPHCKAIDRFERLCDEPGCLEIGSSGTPCPVNRYKTHCHLHPPTAALLPKPPTTKGNER